MKQFLLPCPPDNHGRVVIRDRDYHYLVRVRRCKLNDLISCYDPSNDSSIEMRVITTDENSIILEISQSAGTNNPPAEKPFKLHLIQALPKGTKLDLIIRQACEAGVSSIQIVQTDHAIPDIQGKADKKHERWQKIAREAFQQSGSAQPCLVYPPSNLDSWCKNPIHFNSHDTLGLFCHESHLEQATLHQYCSTVPKDIYIVIGPEGGLSQRETIMLMEHGLKPIYFGSSILRTETAALFALAAVQMILLEADSWVLRLPLHTEKLAN